MDLILFDSNADKYINNVEMKSNRIIMIIIPFLYLLYMRFIKDIKISLVRFFHIYFGFTLSEESYTSHPIREEEKKYEIFVMRSFL